MSESLELLTSPEEAAWDAFVAEAEVATACHTSAWARVWRAEWPGARWQALVWKKDERILAGLGFLERSSPLGRQLLSMPDGTYGGPLVAGGMPAEAAAFARRRLLTRYAELARARGVLRSQLTWLAPPGETPARDLLAGEGGDLPPGLDLEQGFTQIIPLSPDFAALLARLPHGVRSRVRQAEEAGLVLRPVTDAAGVAAYHELAVRNARRHGSRPRPLSLYRRVFEHMAPRGLARFDLVEHRGETIGGSLHLLYGGRALNWLTVAGEDQRALRPSHFVIARWLRELCAAGFREYDLGGSPAQARGLIEFKESWGAARRPVITLRRRGLLHRLLGR